MKNFVILAIFDLIKIHKQNKMTFKGFAVALMALITIIGMVSCYKHKFLMFLTLKFLIYKERRISNSM